MYLKSTYNTYSKISSKAAIPPQSPSSLKQLSYGEGHGTVIVLFTICVECILSGGAGGGVGGGAQAEYPICKSPNPMCNTCSHGTGPLTEFPNQGILHIHRYIRTIFYDIARTLHGGGNPRKTVYQLVSLPRSNNPRQYVDYTSTSSER